MENIIKYVILVLFIAAVGALIFMAGYSRSKTLALSDRTGQSAGTLQSDYEAPPEVKSGSRKAEALAGNTAPSSPDKKEAAEAREKAGQYAKEHPEAAEKEISEMSAYLTLPAGLSPENRRDHMLLLAAKKQEAKKSGTRAGAETVTMGLYPQREGTPEEPIEWRIIDRLDSKTVFVVSANVLEYKAYDDEHKNETLSYFWYKSTLKKWLNVNFYNSAFSDEEKQRILTSDIILQSGATVKDRVFILHTEEAKLFFRDDRDRICLPTPRAKAQKPHYPGMGDADMWWARSNNNGLGTVTAQGQVIDMVGPAGLYPLGVRPAMWIRLR